MPYGFAHVCTWFRSDGLERRVPRMKNSKNRLVKFFAILGCLVAVAAIAYAVYKFFTPDYLEDFEDDFDDDFDEYFETAEEEAEPESAQA